ncbi:MAG: NAD(P)-binding protein, partial [Mycobacterium sp.]
MPELALGLFDTNATFIGREAFLAVRQKRYRLVLMGEQQFDVIIVGAGFGGIGAAIQLKRLGYDNILIVDREDDL